MVTDSEPRTVPRVAPFRTTVVTGWLPAAMLRVRTKVSSPLVPENVAGTVRSSNCSGRGRNAFRRCARPPGEGIRRAGRVFQLRSQDGRDMARSPLRGGLRYNGADTPPGAQ